MKPVVIDVNVFLDLIKLQMLECLFKYGFQVYSTREVIDHLNENQSQPLKQFIESGQLIVYHLSETELEEAICITSSRALEIADKSVAWLSIHLSGYLILANSLYARYFETNQSEIKDLIWLFDILIEEHIISHVFAIQKIKQLLKINRRISREECGKRIIKWELLHLFNSGL
jgi:hypothetical protein